MIPIKDNYKFGTDPTMEDQIRRTNNWIYKTKKSILDRPSRSWELRFELRRSELIFRTWARSVQFVDCRVRTRVRWVSELRADDGQTVRIEKLRLSLLVSKT